MTITERIRDYILTRLATEMQPEALTSDYALIDNGVLDSVDVFELMSYVEEEYRIPIADEDMTYQNLRSLSAIASLVETKLAADGRSGMPARAS